MKKNLVYFLHEMHGKTGSLLHLLMYLVSVFFAQPKISLPQRSHKSESKHCECASSIHVTRGSLNSTDANFPQISLCFCIQKHDDVM